jgi:hypothetical protein
MARSLDLRPPDTAMRLRMDENPRSASKYGADKIFAGVPAWKI